MNTRSIDDTIEDIFQGLYVVCKNLAASFEENDPLWRAGILDYLNRYLVGETWVYESRIVCHDIDNLSDIKDSSNIFIAFKHTKRAETYYVRILIHYLLFQFEPGIFDHESGKDIDFMFRPRDNSHD